jgi:hypothetical protein
MERSCGTLGVWFVTLQGHYGSASAAQEADVVILDMQRVVILNMQSFLPSSALNPWVTFLQ